MSRPTRVIPSVSARLAALGERLRAARQRRRVSQAELAVRIGVSRPTVIRLERGDLNVAIGLLARALGILGLEADLDLLAANDERGRILQDLTLPRRTGHRARTRP